ncbi:MULTISPECIES: hypothetical protein [unclassified Mesorhizobium]|uniref:hypothetical protein n=1 Tax=unclassified Mesorhizobium TaxID=325217 RepID=UPI0003D04032|nr:MULTISPECIES: hypothetical protein [unclassified Mesorhizobium]ESZ07281.1 hypothetical protein X736_13485 [Mesorhizobium sp. L2C089B000]ESZ33867.1 hypothetical protein X733_13830 [Mesorhizobium sp. L2C067A000]WJI53028.1 hypothetical protein NLY44_10325 [Mesorhizobium sp. C089B]
MADAKKITFPKAPLVYPALQRPDTKFDALGAYKADIRLSLEEAKPFIDRIQAVVKAWSGKPAKPGTKNAFYKKETDDEGNETGFVIFSIRVKNRVGKKDGKTWDRRPLLIDAKKTPVDVNPWGGTIARVQAEMFEWEFGGVKAVSLQPVVVQIIELKTGQGQEPQLDDFDEEDGFASHNTDTSDFNDESDGSASGSSDDEAGDY